VTLVDHLVSQTRLCDYLVDQVSIPNHMNYDSVGLYDPLVYHMMKKVIEYSLHSATIRSAGVLLSRGSSGAHCVCQLVLMSSSWWPLHLLYI
jgi:hypothetical protein